MILREISVATKYKSKHDTLYEGFICMCELFSRLLYQFKFQSPARKFILLVIEDVSNKTFLGGGIFEKEVQFDFESYISLSNYNRRIKIVDIIYEQLIIFVEDYNLNKIPIQETYKTCKELKYENRWIHSNKKYTSPKRDYKVELECEWDETHLHIFILLYDKKGQLLVKYKWFDEVSRVGYVFYNYKGSFIDDYIFDFRDEYRYQKWKIDIRSIL